jgi:PEP-CTERM motif-containing protein
MKKTPRLAQLFFLAVFAILGSTWGVGRAHAGTIGLFTGSWQLESPDGTGFQDQTVFSLQGPISSTVFARVDFIGSISGYSEQGSGCDKFGAPCLVTWSGILSGGTVSFDACCSQTGPINYSFTGQITGGSFGGEMFCDFDECVGENRGMFSFISTATSFVLPPGGPEVLNAWSSQGTFSYRGCVGQCGPDTFGTLTMTTVTTPEPGSVTLLGAGMAAVATLRRRRRSRVAVG